MSFFNMFKEKLDVIYDSSKDTYTCIGRYAMPVFINRAGRNNTDRLFIKMTRNEFTFKRVFLYEVVELLKKAISNPNHRSYAKNMVYMLNELQKLEDERLATHSHKVLNYDLISKVIKHKPFDYQLEFFKYYEEYKTKTDYRGILLDAAAGSGKTLSALSISVGLETEYTIIICPLATLEKVWIHSLTEDCFKQPQTYWTTKSPGVYNNEKYIVVHYEAIDKLYDIIGKINNRRITVIVDEVHSFAAEKSKRTVLLNDILNLSKSQDIILMSGTPVKSYTTEIINIVRFIDGNITAKDFDVLKYMYGNPNKFFRSILPNKYKAISYKIEKKETKLEPFDTTYVPITLKNSERYTLPFIKEEMKKYVERRITEIDEMMPTVIDVYNQCLTMALDNGYPSKNMDRYKVLVSQIQDAYKKKTLGLIPQVLLEANKLENEIAKYLPIEYKKQFIEFKTIIKYPMLKIQGECLGRVILRARIDCHIDIAANLQYDEFIESTVKDSILFSNYVEVCNAARIKTMSMGYQPVCVYGENVKGLNASLKVFGENKKANPLITTYKALSTGVPLTNANVIIALDLPFRMYVFEQAVARAWRVGQDSKVVVFIPTLDTGDVPNINQRNFDIITFFNSVVEEITGYKNAINIKETKDLEGLSLESYNNKVMGLDMDSFFHIFKYDMSLKETVDNSFKLKYLEW